MSLSPAKLLGASLQTLWPAACAACDRPIPDAALFCAACNLSINPLVGACSGCALPIQDLFAVVDGTTRCGTCRRVPLPFARATAGFEYGEALAEALVRMKHGGRRYLARRLARLLVQPLAAALARGQLERADAVVAVPLHAHKLRARGFNQALELARWALVGLAHTPALAPGGGLPRLERYLLHRVRPTRELGHAGPAARFAEVAGAFLVSDTARLRGRRVLLVDDVFTTGATFSECADALLRGGAASVDVLALARAV
ncbi:MAG TPA: ComF family protein [Polyangia bacterium]|jgi:predicted amidophosphoribosyltransferase|nr:ComF family protein [Polyangia bacterium]